MSDSPQESNEPTPPTFEESIASMRAAGDQFLSMFRDVFTPLISDLDEQMQQADVSEGVRSGVIVSVFELLTKGLR